MKLPILPTRKRFNKAADLQQACSPPDRACNRPRGIEPQESQQVRIGFLNIPDDRGITRRLQESCRLKHNEINVWISGENANSRLKASRVQKIIRIQKYKIFPSGPLDPFIPARGCAFGRV